MRQIDEQIRIAEKRVLTYHSEYKRTKELVQRMGSADYLNELTTTLDFVTQQIKERKRHNRRKTDQSYKLTQLLQQVRQIRLNNHRPKTEDLLLRKFCMV